MIKEDELFSTEGVTRSERSLHTPGDFARQNLLYVQEVGKLKSLKPHRCIREKLDSFLFMIVLSGKGTVESRNRNYDIMTGDCVFLDCDEHYEHISDEEDGWELAWVHFNGHAAKPYHDLFEKYNAGRPIFRAADSQQFLMLIEELLQNQQDRGLRAEMACGTLLLKLLNLILENVMDVMETDSEDEVTWASQVREFLNENYADTDVFADLVQKLKQPLGQIRERFQNDCGISLEEYVCNRQLNAAKEMLRFTIKPIEEISAEAGLGDVTVMQKLFREKENMTAEEYRMKWAQWIK